MKKKRLIRECGTHKNNVPYFLINRAIADYQAIGANKPEHTRHHLVAAGSVMAVQQNDFVRFLVHDGVGMAQAQHVFSVFALVGVTNAGLARHEWLEAFGAQCVEHLDRWDVQVTIGAAVVRFFGKDRRCNAGNLFIAQGYIAADHARVTEVTG